MGEVDERSTTQSHPRADAAHVAETECPNDPLKVLIVDDDESVHRVTRLVLRDFRFRGREIDFLGALSGLEARRVLVAHPDTAVALIDVVMETDSSGLELIRWIREELRNDTMRIVIRTGQPGCAPERQVIEQYQINDYKEKTELTSTRLATTLTVALRGYCDLVTISRGRAGLEQIVATATSFWDHRSIDDYLTHATECAAGLLGATSGESDATIVGCAEPGIIRATTESGGQVMGAQKSRAQSARAAVIESACNGGGTVYHPPYVGTLLEARRGSPSAMVLRTARPIDDVDRFILSAYSSTVALGLDGLTVALELERSQREMIYLLGELVEKRSKETGHHVKRVGEIVRRIAELSGQSPETADRWHLAATLHDVGKMGIPDAILENPGKLLPAEFRQMQEHTVIGSRLLQRDHGDFMTIASTIARSHHERWDGSGYPDALAGESIPQVAQMTAIADVFDALTHERVYKEAWEFDRAFSYVVDRSERDFHPDIVQLFVRLEADVAELLEQFPD
ncbi:MAG: HD domain-containing protein [Spirochaetaceae bacterium]|nr:MAG: HD domain-containing protein [Spirochaetaceae bacterium]